MLCRSARRLARYLLALSPFIPRPSIPLLKQPLLRLHVALAFVEQLELAAEFVDAFEFVILAREADERDFVDVSQFAHHDLAYELAIDFAVGGFVQLIFDFVGELLFGVLCDFALATGCGDASQNVLAIKWHAATITLDHHELGSLLDALVGGESLIASKTLTAATNDLACIAAAAIDHAVVIFLAGRATHGRG